MLPHGEDSGVWLPDVAITTADSYYDLPKNELYQVRIQSNGRTDSAPGGFIRFQCKMNLKYFPFDDMKCTARIESWFYNNQAQVFDQQKSTIYVYNWTEHEQWRLDKFNMSAGVMSQEASEGSHNVLTFSLHLSRKAGYYLMNIVVPSVILSTLELVTFSLPPNQTVRIEVSFMCLFAYTMFQSVIQADLPKSADETPMLSIYITVMIVYIAIAILLQCIVLSMTNQAILGSKVPRWMVRFANEKNKQFWEATAHDEDNDSVDGQQAHEDAIETEHANQRRRANAKVWKNLATLLDRSAAIGYACLIIFTSILLLGIIPAVPR